MRKGSEKWNESGTWSEKREKLLCHFKGKRGKERKRGDTKSKTPFPISKEEIKTCVVTREGAFILVFL